MGRAEAYPCCHRARGGVHSRHAASLGGWNRETEAVSRSHSHQWPILQPINLTKAQVYLWIYMEEEAVVSKDNAKQIKGEHATSTQKSSSLHLNPRSFHCETTLPTTVLPFDSTFQPFHFPWKKWQLLVQPHQIPSQSFLFVFSESKPNILGLSFFLKQSWHLLKKRHFLLFSTDRKYKLLKVRTTGTALNVLLHMCLTSDLQKAVLMSCKCHRKHLAVRDLLMHVSASSVWTAWQNSCVSWLQLVQVSESQPLTAQASAANLAGG